MIKYIIVLLYIMFSSIGMVMIRKGGLQSQFSIGKLNAQITISWEFVIGVLLYIVSFLLWMYILQLFPLTYISPIVYGITFIVMSVLSSILLKETINIRMIVASVLIIVGVTIACLPQK